MNDLAGGRNQVKARAAYCIIFNDKLMRVVIRVELVGQLTQVMHQ